MQIQTPLDSLWHYDSIGYTNANPSNDTLNVGTLFPTAPGHREALHLLWAIIHYGWALARQNTPDSTSIPGIRVYYGPGYPEVTGYVPSTRKLYISGNDDSADLDPDPWDDSVVIHEYGHHLANDVRILRWERGRNRLASRD